MKTFAKHHAVLAALLVCAVAPTARGAEANGKAAPRYPLQIRREFPRLVYTKPEFAAYRANAAKWRESDADFKALSDKFTGGDPKKATPWLAAFLWQATGERRYFEAAFGNTQKQIQEIKQWNPLSNFWEHIEFSLVYDWLYNDMDAGQRAFIEERFFARALDELSKMYRREALGGASNYLCRPEHNRSISIHTSAVVLALAAANRYPEQSQEVLEHALPYLAVVYTNFGPDGTWHEGYNYWRAGGHNYVTLAIAALQNSCGHTFGLSEIAEGNYRVTGDIPLYLTGPTGYMFNYSDASFRPVSGHGFMFWFAQQFKRPDYVWSEHYATTMIEGRTTAWSLPWYAPRPRDPSVLHKLPLDHLFRAPFSLISMRSAWQDPQALSVAMIGGGNRGSSKTHLHMGSFEINSQGHLWTVEFGFGGWTYDKKYAPDFMKYGSFSFSLNPAANYFNLFNRSSRSHNVPLLDNQNQLPNAWAEVLKYESNPDAALAVIDMSLAYPAAETMQRGLMMLPGRKALLLQDEYAWQGQHDLTWGMGVDAAVRIAADGKSATLEHGGKRLALRLLEAPPAARFSVRKPAVGLDLKTPPDLVDKELDIIANTKQIDGAPINYQRLTIELPGTTGQTRLAVLIAPADETIAAPTIVPLRDWKLPAAKTAAAKWHSVSATQGFPDYRGAWTREGFAMKCAAEGEATLQFTGTAVRVFGKGEGAQFFLDDKAVAPRPENGALFVSTTLNNGAHTLKVVAAGPLTIEGFEYLTAPSQWHESFTGAPPARDASGEKQTLRVEINGKAQDIAVENLVMEINYYNYLPPQPPVLWDGTAMIPVEMLKKLGMNVSREAQGRVKIVRLWDEVTLQTGSAQAWKNGEAFALSKPPIAVGGTVLLPTSVLSEALGYSVRVFANAERAGNLLVNLPPNRVAEGVAEYPSRRDDVKILQIHTGEIKASFGQKLQLTAAP